MSMADSDNQMFTGTRNVHVDAIQRSATSPISVTETT